MMLVCLFNAMITYLKAAYHSKAKGLDVLSKVTLTEAEQLKLATKRSKQYFHISHASGSCDRVDTQLKVPGEEQQKTSSTDEGTTSSSKSSSSSSSSSLSLQDSLSLSELYMGTSRTPDIVLVPSSVLEVFCCSSPGTFNYSDDNNESDDEDMESDRDEIHDPNLTNVDQTEHEKEDVDERVHTPSDYELTVTTSMEDTMSKFMSELAKRHEENSNLIKEIRASTDATIRNQGAFIKTLEIRIGQVSKVLQERGFGSLPSFTEANPRDQVNFISTTIEAESCPIRYIGSD
nr:hypothetical protein [Tanacetum cinerariifolium]